MPLLWLHAALALACAGLLARQFFGRTGRRNAALATLALAAAMASGLGLLARVGGLENALFFGHVMHWLGWLAVLVWAHALLRGLSEKAVPKAGLSLLLVLAACAAGLLALVQERI